MQRFAVALIVLAGCGHAAVREANRSRLVDLESRASYELKCPRANLEIIVLKTTDDLIRLAGVDGCGHRATYHWRGYLDGEWFLGSSTTPVHPVGSAKD